MAALALVTGAAGALGSLEGVASERFDPMLAALFLLAVLALGGVGIVPAVRRRFEEPRTSLDRRRRRAGAGAVDRARRAAGFREHAALGATA